MAARKLRSNKYMTKRKEKRLGLFIYDTHTVWLLSKCYELCLLVNLVNLFLCGKMNIFHEMMSFYLFMFANEIDLKRLANTVDQKLMIGIHLFDNL